MTLALTEAGSFEEREVARAPPSVGAWFGRRRAAVLLLEVLLPMEERKDGLVEKFQPSLLA